MSLALAPESDETQMLGYTAGDLQENVAVGRDSITGTLKYVDGSSWDGAGWPADEEAGNFLALKAVNVPEGATVVVELENGVHGPATLDSDLNIVIRIANKNTQRIKVVATLDDYVVRRTYSLKGLTLASA